MARRVQGRTTWARTRGMCASPLALAEASGPATGCAHAAWVCATTPVATGGATGALVDTLLVRHTVSPGSSHSWAMGSTDDQVRGR